jgi:hypothetical protein
MAAAAEAMAASAVPSHGEEAKPKAVIVPVAKHRFSHR